jgi:type I restriction enzyme S subunit
LAQGPGIVIGRKGNPGIVTWVPTDFFPIDTTFYVAPKDSALSILFLFYALQGQNLPSLGADSAVPGLNRNMAYMNQWVIPPTKLVRAFDNKCFPLYDKIQEYNEESLTLTALRDTLLPKLLSGELRVPDYEKLMGDIA